ELLLFAGMTAAVAVAGRIELPAVRAAVAASPSGPIVAGLLLAGFGVKVGAVPLHMWLPLAHPAAPTPASAVLSGAMSTAGLLGWLRVLPFGDASLPSIGIWVLAAGMLAAFAGVAAGLTQTDAKTALAYSSISQMGLLTMAVGAGLAAPEAW